MDLEKFTEDIIEWVKSHNTKLKKGTACYDNLETPCCIRGTMLKMMGYINDEIVDDSTFYNYQNQIGEYFGLTDQQLESLEYGFEDYRLISSDDQFSYNIGVQIRKTAQKLNLMERSIYEPITDY